MGRAPMPGTLPAGRFSFFLSLSNPAHMKKLTANDPETRSADIVAENIAHLQTLFPEAFTEGRIDFDVLRQLLGAAVDEREEKYGMNWLGKRAAGRRALTPSAATLRPAPEESVDWDTTGNLMIEGDNLEALKLLQKSYAGKVKLIYIDPPYNTGKDFVYPDKFQDTIGNYLELTGQSEAGGRLTSNPETSGRFHTDWLNMMYPRLKVARELLKEDGVIFASIDDREVAHLRMLFDEVFGEENFIGSLVWKGATDNNPSRIAIEHEYILCFCRSKDAVSPTWKNLLNDAKSLLISEYNRLANDTNLSSDEIQNAIRSFIRKNRDSLAAITHYDRVDSNGLYTGSRKVHNPKPGGYIYDIIHPRTGETCVPPINGYRYPKDRMDELIANGRVLFGDDHQQIIQIKEYLSDFQGKLSSVIHLDSRTGSNEMNALFGVQKLFSNPKPTLLLKSIFEFVLQSNDCVLDFFAGSGTTGHAVMAQNAVDGGNRRYILVQIPEPLDPAHKDQKVAAEFCDALGKPRTIAELTKERLRRAGAKARAAWAEEQAKKAAELFDASGAAAADAAAPTPPDTGFRVFRLDRSNIRAWAPDADDLAGTLLEHTEHILPGRTEADILYELLLKLGLDLCVPIERFAVPAAGATAGGKPPRSDGKARRSAQTGGDSHTVHVIGGGMLIVCLSERIAREDAEPLALAIAERHAALAPAGDATVVFRDSAFADDVAKTNIAAILTQHGLATVRSL